jgi:NTP pyrophosphatase (non-canonical NTP hydrolase)
MDSLAELTRKLRDFAQERDWEQFHSPKNLAMAMIVEAAELVEHFQWLTAEQSTALDPAKREEVRQEIGDVLIYLTRIADRLGIDPVAAAHDKMVINAAKYPAELARGSAAKSTEYAKS